MADRMRSRVAAFLDRDGTINLDTNYVRDPDTVELLPGAAAAIRRLAQLGIPSVVVTNQSGIARGLISMEQYRAVRQRIGEMLRAEGAVLLDSFCCPHHPALTGPCDCRKPGTGLHERAAAMYGLDLARSWYIGDKSRDTDPATKFGARAFLVRSNRTPESDVELARAADIPVVDSLADAVAMIPGSEQ